jgi:segregation and condensation protein B
MLEGRAPQPPAGGRGSTEPQNGLVLLRPREPVELGLEAQLVAVLFVAAGPVSRSDLARTLEIAPEMLDRALGELARNPPLGLSLVEHRQELSLTTAPGVASAVERFLGTPTPVRLSRAALETLAIIAYQQPVTRGAVEAVRGVNSDSAVATLLGRGLIAEVGRKETVGRPTLLATTPECLHYLGLTSLGELPPLPERG